MHPAPLTPPQPDGRDEKARPTKTEVREGMEQRSPETEERATSRDEEALLLGDAQEEKAAGV